MPQSGPDLREIRKFVAPEIVLGAGASMLAGQYAWNLGIRRALLVSDPGVAEAGWTALVAQSLRDADLDVSIFEGVNANPRDSQVMAGAEAYRAERCDGLVAVGGGSPMDAAKGIGIIVTNGRHILEYEGVDRIEVPIPPLLCVPTTAGSSADVSQFAIINDTARHVKIAIVSRAMVPDASLVDPRTLTTMPAIVTAGTGIDALTHAVEAVVSSASSSLTDLLAIDAIGLVRRHLPRCLEAPDDVEARSAMARASLLAGMAFSNAILGATHALAHGIGGLLDAPHGVCNALLIDHVVRYNFSTARERYFRVAEALGLEARGRPSGDVEKELATALHELRRRAGIEGTLATLGVGRSDIPLIARHALADVCLATNPRPADQRDLEVILEEAL